MEESIKVDSEYKDAFNLGYELAKELNLKSPMFKNLNSGNGRMHAMQAGMTEFGTEVVKEKNEKIDESSELNRNKRSHPETDERKNKGKDTGFDLSIS